MRVVLAALGIAFLASCADRADRDSFSGEAARLAEQQAKERCAAEGKRAALRDSSQNLDGSRRFEYVCVQ
jgi:hypothetical protein